MDNVKLQVYYGENSLYNRASTTSLAVLEGNKVQELPFDYPIYIVTEFDGH